MKKFFYIITLVTFALFSTALTEGECDSKALKKEGIAQLSPYFYSASKVNIINYKYKQEIKEIEVPLFKGERYKLIFNKTALPKDVLIEVYDKSRDKSSRNKLFTSEGSSEQILSYSPKKSRKLFVNYTIPEADGMKESGCLVFILGYQLTFLDDYNKKNNKAETEESTGE